MGDDRDRQTPERRRLEARLESLEERLRELDRTPAGHDRAATIERELQALRGTVDDLATDVLDLHDQMASLVSACERLLAGAAGGGLDLSLDRGLGSRGPVFVLRRSARRAARGLVGAARRVLRPTEREEAPAPILDVRRAREPATEAPALAVVLRTAVDPEETEIPAVLAAAAGPGIELVAWNPETGAAAVRGGAAGAGRSFSAADRRRLAEQLGADWVAELDDPPPVLLPTTLELCRWTIASEGVPLRVSCDRSTAFAIRSVEDWRSVGNPSTGAHDPPPLTKLVGGASRATGGAAGRARTWLPSRGGSGYLIASGGRATGHDAADLAGVVPALDGDDPRPHVVVATRWPGAAAKVAAWVVESLRDELSVSVVLTEPCSDDRRLVRAMAERTPAVYPAADFLDRAVLPSAVADLARARGASAVVRVGGARAVVLEGGGVPPIVDLPLSPADVDPKAFRVAAFDRSIADAARAAGVEAAALDAAPALPEQPPSADDAAAVRSGLGVPADHRLVLALADLVPDQRPEDVAAVANRLRHRTDTRVVLVGAGGLAGTVADIARHFGLTNFTVAPPTHDPLQLLLAADVVLATAEHEPWPATVAAALALGRPVVATAPAGRSGLADEASGERLRVVPTGDVAALAAAVEAALDGRPPRATKKAWKAARARTERARGRLVELVAGAAAGSAKDGG